MFYFRGKFSSDCWHSPGQQLPPVDAMYLVATLLFFFFMALLLCRPAWQWRRALSQLIVFGCSGYCILWASWGLQAWLGGKGLREGKRIRRFSGEGSESEPTAQMAQVWIEWWQGEGRPARIRSPGSVSFPSSQQLSASFMRSRYTLSSGLFSLSLLLTQPFRKAFPSLPPPFSPSLAPQSVFFSPTFLLSLMFYRIHSIWLAFSPQGIDVQSFVLPSCFCFQETKYLLCVMFSCAWLMITEQLWAIYLYS